MATEVTPQDIPVSEKPVAEPAASTDRVETETADTTEETPQGLGTLASPAVSKSKRTRPSYKFDANKITLRFLFANNDGITVTMECDPTDTVAAIKTALVSVWPDELSPCNSEEQLRLVCMGKGYLSPNDKTLGEFEIPTFKTHPTPVNVSLRPSGVPAGGSLKARKSKNAHNASTTSTSAAGAPGTDQGCSCTIL